MRGMPSRLARYILELADEWISKREKQWRGFILRKIETRNWHYVGIKIDFLKIRFSTDPKVQVRMRRIADAPWDKPNGKGSTSRRARSFAG